MKTYFYFFLGFAVVFVAALTARSLRLCQKSGTKYDERQVLAQGTAFKAAYCVLVLYCAAYVVLKESAGFDWLDAFTGISLGIILSVLVFAVVCIAKDAYFHSVDSPVLTSVAFLAAGAIDVFFGLQGVLSGTDTWVILFAGVMFLTVGAAALIKRAADRKRDADE